MKKLTLVALAALLVATATHAGWWKTYGGDGAEVGYCVQITSEGNYIICGEKGANLWLIEVDTSGKMLWSREHGYGGGRWVEETNDGGFVVTWYPGLFKTDAQGDSLWFKDYGIVPLCVHETNDSGLVVTGRYPDWPLVLLKTDYLGNDLWERSYLVGDWDVSGGAFIQQTKDAGYIVTGFVADTGGGWFDINNPGQYLALLLLKTNSLGDTLWTHVDTNYGGGSCVRQTKDGGYVVTTSRGLLKTDSLGEVLWHKVYTSDGGFHTVQQTFDGGYILAGGEFWNLLLVKTDEQGDTLWTRNYGNDGQEIGHCAQQTSDGGYIIVGYTSSFGAGSTDVYLLKTDSLGLLTVLEEPILIQKNWRIISAIGSNIVLCYSECPQGFRADVFDISGRKIDEIHNSGSSGILSWGENFLPGVYFICAPNKLNQTVTAKVVIIH